MKVIFLLLHKLWIVVAILSIYVIINIELLPDTYRCTIDNKAKEINAILLTYHIVPWLQRCFIY